DIRQNPGRGRGPGPRACRPGAGLPRARRHGRGALRGRGHDRCRGPHLRRPHEPHAGPAGGGRERHRRGRHHRGDPRGQGRARRLHPAHGQSRHPGGERRPLCEPRLRPAPRLRADHERRRDPDDRRREKGPAGQGFRRVRRLSQGQCGQDELRHRRGRRHVPPHLPFSQLPPRRKPAARAVPRLRPGAQRADRRANRLCLRPDGRHRAADPGQRGQGPRGRRAEPRSGDSRHAYRGRAGPAAIPGDGLERVVRPERRPQGGHRQGECGGARGAEGRGREETPARS
ncbi:MAG: BUG/TctC family periplasmic protein, partial [uncultured Microvirga sp.]